jgi:hypothetical protein
VLGFVIKFIEPLQAATAISYSAVTKSRALQFTIKQTQWPESSSELYRPSDRRLSEKLVSMFADRECRVVSAADPLRP